MMYAQYCIATIQKKENAWVILGEMVFHVEIKSGVCQEYVPFLIMLQQKTKNACLVMTLALFDMNSKS